MLYEKYLSKANIPSRYMEEIPLYPEQVDEQAFIQLNTIKESVDKFVAQGENLLIYSNYVGNGKTTWATKILKAYLQKVSQFYFEEAPALFINVTSFLNEKRLAISDSRLLQKINELERQILSAQIVVFDDLGVKDITAYDTNNLYYWIDYRTANNKSCIYTSNLLPAQLMQILDPRLYDRIVNYSTQIIIQGGSNRGLPTQDVR